MGSGEKFIGGEKECHVMEQEQEVGGGDDAVVIDFQRAAVAFKVARRAELDERALYLKKKLEKIRILLIRMMGLYLRSLLGESDVGQDLDGGVVFINRGKKGMWDVGGADFVVKDKMVVLSGVKSDQCSDEGERMWHLLRRKGFELLTGVDDSTLTFTFEVSEINSFMEEVVQPGTTEEWRDFFEIYRNLMEDS